MYNNLTNLRRGRPWLLLAALFAWLLPQNAVADSPLLQPYHYQGMLNGSNTVRISAPIYDEVSTDNWTNNATLTIKWTDKNKIEHSEVLLTWKADILFDPFGVSMYDNDKSEVPAKFETKTGGSIEISKTFQGRRFAVFSTIGGQRGCDDSQSHLITRQRALFCTALCRNAALDVIKKNSAQKRSAQLVELTHEMNECIPDQNSISDDRSDELKGYINEYLSTLPKDKRAVFLGRYWYNESVSEIARWTGYSQSKVKTMLHRTREGLRKFIIRKEGSL